MKKTAFIFLLSLFAVLPLFSLEIGVGGGLVGNARVDSNASFSLTMDDGRNSFSSFIEGGEVLSLSVSRRGDFFRKTGWRIGVASNAFSYGTSSLLVDAVIGGEYGTEYVNLKGSLGVQGGVVKYKSIDRFLFTLSPLASLILELLAEENLFHIYMSFTMPWERQAKAVPTFGFEYRRTLSKSVSFSIDFWGKNAEYLMDPWMSFQSYGTMVSINVEV